MRKRVQRPSEQSIGWRLGYRLDRFLNLHPATQLFTVLVAACIVTVGFGVAIQYFDDSAAESRVKGVSAGLWWAITRMLDGGTVASDGDTGLARRALGVVVTIIGLAAVAIVTGSFASSFTDRLRGLRTGSLPVFEKGHVLLLGWNAHAGVIVRELALSGSRIKLVIVADHERESIEENLRELLNGTPHRLVIIVRRGDPTTTASARRAAARRAHAVVILPDTCPAALADRAALRSLLAVRRTIGRRRVPILVEVSSATGRELLRLCKSPGYDGLQTASANPKLPAESNEVVIVEAGELNARFVAQSVRQRGVFDVARQILSLDERSIYFHDAAQFAGQTFDDAHAAIDGAVLLGLVRGDAPILSPAGATVLQASDRLLVFSDKSARPSTHGELPDVASFAPPDSTDGTPKKLHVLAVRFRVELCTMLRFLEVHGAVRATVLVLPQEAEAARTAIAAASFARTEIDLIVGDPLDGNVINAALEKGFDTVLLLAPHAASSDAADADADQLITLLQVRRHVRARGIEAKRFRVVVEIRSPETARLAVGLANPDDFVLSREIVGMLLAQELHAICLEQKNGAWVGPIYHALLETIGPSLELYPLDAYAGGQSAPSFAELAARARRAGFIAIGVKRTGERSLLLPARDARFEVDRGSKLVVLRGSPHEAREPMRVLVGSASDEGLLVQSGSTNSAE